MFVSFDSNTTSVVCGAWTAVTFKAPSNSSSLEAMNKCMQKCTSRTTEQAKHKKYTPEELKHRNVSLVSILSEQVKYRNVHVVSRTTEQVKYRNVHLVSRTTEQVKYRNVHLVSRTPEQVEYRNVHRVTLIASPVKSHEWRKDGIIISMLLYRPNIMRNGSP